MTNEPSITDTKTAMRCSMGPPTLTWRGGGQSNVVVVPAAGGSGEAARFSDEVKKAVVGCRENRRTGTQNSLRAHNRKLIAHSSFRRRYEPRVSSFEP